MIVVLTGTPGTGKTSIAEEIEDFRVINLTSFVKENELGEHKEEFEVDISTMVEALEDEIEEDENVIIEGHLAHHFPADLCVVLRCNPEELEDRLQGRDYPDRKIEENVESEILDVVLSEAVEKQENIIEINTTGREVDDVAGEVKRRIEEKDTGYGNIDWTDYL